MVLSYGRTDKRITVTWLILLEVSYNPFLLDRWCVRGYGGLSLREVLGCSGTMGVGSEHPSIEPGANKC